MMQDYIAKAIMDSDGDISPENAQTVAREFIELAHDAGYHLVSSGKYEQLVHDSNVLTALENYGVDNWEGWSDALRSLEEDR